MIYELYLNKADIFNTLYELFLQETHPTLAGVAQWIEHWPTN